MFRSYRIQPCVVTTQPAAAAPKVWFAIMIPALMPIYTIWKAGFVHSGALGKCAADLPSCIPDYECALESVSPNTHKSRPGWDAIYAFRAKKPVKRFGAAPVLFRLIGAELLSYTPNPKYRLVLWKLKSATSLFSRRQSAGYWPLSTHSPISSQSTRRKYSCRG